MDNFSIQFLLNSGPLPYLTVRHAELFASPSGRLKLIGFLFAAFMYNALLNLDRFGPLEAVLRASAIALVVAICIFGFAFFLQRRRARQLKPGPQRDSNTTAADTPATPPDRAP